MPITMEMDPKDAARRAEVRRREGASLGMVIDWVERPFVAEIQGSARKPYRVDLRADAKRACTCMDWALRGRSRGLPCKHVLAVVREAKLEMLQPADLDPSVVEALRQVVRERSAS